MSTAVRRAVAAFHDVVTTDPEHHGQLIRDGLDARGLSRLPVLGRPALVDARHRDRLAEVAEVTGRAMMKVWRAHLDHRRFRDLVPLKPAYDELVQTDAAWADPLASWR